MFAPTDAAITAVVEALGITPEELLASEDLSAILQYHVVVGVAMSTDLSDGQMIETLLGPDVTVSITADGVFINDAQVTVVDLAADNGVVHVIDAVLLPPAPPATTVVDVIAGSPDHELLEAAVGAAGLVDFLSAEGPFTVFAPTDAAVTALVEALEITAEELLALEDLGDILKYHVVAGEAMSTDLVDGQTIATLLGPDVTVTINDEGVFINNAQVTVVDIAADNGVVHVIDAVLLPPAPPTNTILDVIQNSPEHMLLAAAVDAAGLSGALSGEDTLTVFAPTDAAITALVEALEITPAELLALETLTDILKYHVVNGLAMSSDLSDGQMIATLLGPDVTVTINDEGVFINDAQVTVVDIMADNGVVHVIDAVLLPPTDNVEEAVAKVQLMPNPASDVVRIGGLQGNAGVVIRDLVGRVVLHADNAGQLFDISHLGAGTYVVSVTQEGATATTKLVVR